MRSITSFNNTAPRRWASSSLGLLGSPRNVRIPPCYFVPALPAFFYFDGLQDHGYSGVTASLPGPSLRRQCSSGPIHARHLERQREDRFGGRFGGSHGTGFARRKRIRKEYDREDQE